MFIVIPFLDDQCAIFEVSLAYKDCFLVRTRPPVFAPFHIYSDFILFTMAATPVRLWARSPPPIFIPYDQFDEDQHAAILRGKSLVVEIIGPQGPEARVYKITEDGLRSVYEQSGARRLLVMRRRSLSAHSFVASSVPCEVPDSPVSNSPFSSPPLSPSVYALSRAPSVERTPSPPASINRSATPASTVTSHGPPGLSPTAPITARRPNLDELFLPRPPSPLDTPPPIPPIVVRTDDEGARTLLYPSPEELTTDMLAPYAAGFTSFLEELRAAAGDHHDAHPEEALAMLARIAAEERDRLARANEQVEQQERERIAQEQAQRERIVQAEYDRVQETIRRRTELEQRLERERDAMLAQRARDEQLAHDDALPRTRLEHLGDLAEAWNNQTAVYNDRVRLALGDEEARRLDQAGNTPYHHPFASTPPPPLFARNPALNNETTRPIRERFTSHPAVNGLIGMAHEILRLRSQEPAPASPMQTSPTSHDPASPMDLVPTSHRPRLHAFYAGAVPGVALPEQNPDRPVLEDIELPGHMQVPRRYPAHTPMSTRYRSIVYSALPEAYHRLHYGNNGPFEPPHIGDAHWPLHLQQQNPTPNGGSSSVESAHHSSSCCAECASRINDLVLAVIDGHFLQYHLDNLLYGGLRGLEEYFYDLCDYQDSMRAEVRTLSSNIEGALNVLAGSLQKLSEDVNSLRHV